jgi:UDP-N-acetylglucosamine--N-acetylmuramyl-(pentapeptide) pyrophosphoryl-undecaprenol N-acetylglucosamine transferase
VLFAGGGTGGHLYPALALAAALQHERPEVQVYFVGAQRGVEARVLIALQHPYTLLPFHPLYRDRAWRNWRLVPSLWRSLRGLRKLFREFKPRLVVGTGGYASAPACLYAITTGVPVAIQEQNSHPGLTTRTISRWAQQVHLGFPEARREIKPGKHTEVTALGNPIRPPDETLRRSECRQKFGLRADSVVVLVVGGSQGARAINETLMQTIASSHGLALARSQVQLLWATGPAHFESITSRLPAEARSWVVTRGYIDNMSEALATADIAISRAGAMATAELLAWGIPSLLIPLPTAAADHQTHNAHALADAGAATLLRERDMTPERLAQELGALVNDDMKRAQMRAAALERARPDAARQISLHLAALLER